MNADALKAALSQLLAHGEKSKDASMQSMVDAKKGAPSTPDLCPECKVPLESGGKCPKCGYSKPETTQDEGDSPNGDDLAGLLESGSKE